MSWKRYTLAELVEHFSVRVKNIDDASSLIFYGISNEDGITVSKYAAEDNVEEYKIIEMGCFAYNPYRINVGSIALMQEDRMGLISPAYVVFKPKKNAIVPKLLLKYLKSSEGLRQIKINSRGTVRQALRFEDLCKIEISLPDYDEQVRLYEDFELNQGKYDKINLEHSHQLLDIKKLRQQILQDAVQGRLLPQDPKDESVSILINKVRTNNKKQINSRKGGQRKPLLQIKPEEIPFEIPKNWGLCRLGEICRVKVGSTPSRGVSEYWNGDIPWVSSGEVANNYIFNTKESITLKGFESTSLILYPKGTVLVAMIGQGKTRGQCSILQIEATINQNVAGLIIQNEIITSKFLWYFFLSRYEITRGGASGGNQPALNGIKISNTVFPLPPYSEQNRIVLKIEKLMNLCDILEHTVGQKQKYTKDLLRVSFNEALTPVEK
jgi:type I restriction enzyme, S subunit